MNVVSQEEFLNILNSKKEMTFEDLEKAEVGRVVSIGCRNCEGFEKHRKLPSGKWQCSNCNNEIEL